MRRDPPVSAIVIFGATGDLARRKLLPALYHLHVEGLLPEGVAVVGSSRSDLGDDAFRELAREAVERFGRHPPSGVAWERFAPRLRYARSSFTEPGGLALLVRRLREAERGGSAGRLFYAATPPAAFPDLVRALGEAGLAPGSRIVIEKPFGRDLASARQLNAAVREVFDESQVFRIDHYMGKETVQNILALRFSNGLFEPIWNRRYLDHVQITVAEEIGIEGRGDFYEQTGCLRDMVQTHLLQVLTFVAMEPPLSFDPDRLRDEKVRVLRAARVCDPARAVFGQYEGYRKEEGVAPGSGVETFVALELEIENWRWAGVPFYLRTGKRLARRASEVTLVFREVPYNVFRGAGVEALRRDHLTIRIQPDEGVTLAINAKRPGAGFALGRATMDFDYERAFPTELLDAYELLLLEAMEGDHTLFLREDAVERAWEILSPLLEAPPPVRPYPPGSWGPPEADELIAPHRWHLQGAGRAGPGTGRPAQLGAADAPRRPLGRTPGTG
ncbi:MAG TPA: glucose-6-phosphate dehydrogenase [Actinomycetota bacterium]|nr:glucose-6-phosphate dehydrogenase [Actinomycetota bacterium]